MSGLRCSVVLCALVLVAGCGSDSSEPDATTPVTQAPLPTATLDSFGPVSLGMTLTEATDALADIPIETSNEHGCTYLTGIDGDPYAELIVFVSDETSRVIGIRTPDGTRTDRGVGDGSTVTELETAYSSDHTIETGRFDGKIVRPKDSADADFLSFPLRDGTLGPPEIGRYYWDDDCL